MNWISKLFAGGVSTVIDSVGTAIDKIVTSDEERLQVRVVLEREMYNFQKAQMAAIADYDKEITTRHANDMKSGSWLSKNIRPLILAFLTFSTILLAYLTIFILDPVQSALVDPWISLLQVLLVTSYSFYFGGRSYEKVKGK